ncbi:hypothetical protein APHAL10511_005720 [Amanita phalloides]|nr:hypothetical protein APHAL10511_005720 [Amanita phalloides]
MVKRKEPESQKAGASGKELAGVGREAGASGMSGFLKKLNPKGQKNVTPGAERQHAGGEEAGTSGTATTENLPSPPHKKLKEDAKYLQAWDEVIYAHGDPTTEGWGQFYEQWWGSASTGKAHFEELHAEGLPPEKSAILVGDAYVQRGFNVLKDSNGWMILRGEYATIYDRLSGLFEAKRSGAILSGNPGIGKSYFAVYALLRRMMEAKTTLFTSSSGSSYLFHETGIGLKDKAQVRIKHLPDAGVNDPTSRVWSLIDGAADRSPEVSMLTDVVTLFVLITCSPKEERYKEWKKQNGGLWWVMNPWTKEELRALLSNPYFTKPSPDQIECYQSTEGIQKLMENLHTKKNIQEALRKLDIDKLINPPDSIPHQLILLLRDKENPLDDDEYLVDFKSQEIYRRARKVLNELSLENSRRLFTTLSSVPAARGLAGVSFEPFANAFIRGLGGPEERAVAFFHFQSMRKTTATDKWPYQFEHNPSDTTNNDSNVPSFASRSQDIHMNITFYYDVETIAPVMQHLYCPDKTNNPMFDSFFFEDSDDGVILWVFQMTIKKIHDAEESGFHILKKIKEKSNEPVTVKFVLVMTYTEERVVWNFPKDLEDFGGNKSVYVLCLR